MTRKRKYPRVIEPTATDCAYAAGFVDGEATIAVVPVWHNLPDGRRREGYSCTVTVTQQDLGPLRWMQQRWGGCIYAHKSGHSDRPCWRLSVNGALQAGLFCADMVPYLQVKRLQAENLIAFAESRKHQGVKGQKTTEEDLAPQRTFHLRSLDLNRKEAI